MGHPHLLQRHTLNNTPCVGTVSTGTRDRDPTHAGRCSSTEQPAHLILWPRQSGIARLLRGSTGLAPSWVFSPEHPAWPLPTLTRLKRDRAIFSSSSSGCWPRINVPPKRNDPFGNPEKTMGKFLALAGIGSNL